MGSCWKPLVTTFFAGPEAGAGLPSRFRCQCCLSVSLVWESDETSGVVETSWLL